MKGCYRMKRRVLGMILVIGLLLCLIPVAAGAPLPMIYVNVGDANTSNENYEITDTSIKLLKRDIAYELTGTTDKKISLWGSNDPADSSQTFCISADGVTINGGIVVENSPVRMRLQLAEGTENTIRSVNATNLSIEGSGTLNASCLDVTQATSYMPSALQITDATVIVTTSASAGDSCQWNGPCILAGNAKVTYIGNGKYAPLKVGVKSGDTTHSLTLKDNAKLYCLQDDPAKPADASVSGLEMFDVPLLLEGNSYLEAEGKDSTSAYAGYGIITSADVTVKDNATIKATGYDVALCADGDLTISGGTAIADSKYSNGIFAAGNIEISNDANVKATGYYPALFGNTGLSITDSQVEATSTADTAIFSRGNVSIKNSMIEANAAQDYKGVGAAGTATVSGSWVETNGPETFDGHITNSVLFNQKSGKVIGNAVLPCDAAVEKDMTLLIPQGTSLSVGSGKTFQHHGKTTVDGSFSADGGTVICTSHTSRGTATCVKGNACAICGAAFGGVNPGNHAALKHVTAKAATESAEGNTEYWYCEACGRYYSDAAATKEIAKADTVVAKLVLPPKTGDSSPLALWLALLLISGGLLATAALKRKAQ